MDMSQPQNIWGVIIALLFLVNTIVQVWSNYKIKKIETNTNSMKDALVQSTKTEALLVGANQERDRATLEAASVIKKIVEEKKKEQPNV